jgi:hypothetical protein
MGLPVLLMDSIRRTTLIVYVLIAAVLMLVAATAVSSFDFTNRGRR